MGLHFNLMILRGKKEQERVCGLGGNGTAAVLWFQVEIVPGRSRNFNQEAAMSFGFFMKQGTKSWLCLQSDSKDLLLGLHISVSIPSMLDN
jgi:hypothetical protein